MLPQAHVYPAREETPIPFITLICGPNTFENFSPASPQSLVSPQILDEYAPLTESVLAAAFEVTNTLGCGFLEKVYERALHRELQIRGIKSVPQAHFPVKYKSHLVGEYTADFLVEDTLIVELKCASSLLPEHTAQCLNYLRAANKPICLLINFHNPKLEWRRLIPRSASIRSERGATDEGDEKG